MSILDVNTFHHHEPKSWGYEKWIVNNDLYCGKILYMQYGKHTSMHFHMKKHETMLCQKGSFQIWFLDTSSGESEFIILLEGDSVVIEPGQPHEIWGHGEGMNELVEFSTHHENSDSYRIGLSSK